MISPARDAALDILLKVGQQSAFASELLHSERLDKLSPQDRGLATELVMGVLRWRSRLDESLAGLSSQKLAKLDVEVLESLRMAAYQIGFLERVPAHAAVNDAVELVKQKKKRSAAPFVNAVLRKLQANQSHISQKQGDKGHQSVPELASLYAHPLWMVGRWAQQYGMESAEKICLHDQQVPATAIRLSDPAAEAELVVQGLTLEPGRLLRTAHIVTCGDVTKTAAFLEGRAAVQDEGSQLVAMMVGRGERLLDCCAAPGGKTVILAERNAQSEIVATELHDHRARAMQERLRRHSNVSVMTADATELAVTGDFDRVLADVPCSGTGTLARNPEIKWRLTPEDFPALHRKQIAILQAALGKLRPGGRLVYSTCSLEPEENEAVVREVLENSNFRMLPVEEELETLRREGTLLLGDLKKLTDRQFLRLLPGAFGSDGFFAAVLGR